jgi:IS5 family transposase
MQIDFLLDEKIYSRLDKLSDPLAKLDEIMEWTAFVSIVDEVRPDKTKQGLGGRPPISSLVLFKGLLIGEIYHLSNDQIEYQITDRASFARFCGLKLGEKAPDANTFWLLKEALKETGKYEDLFQALLQALAEAGLEYSKCAIVDATFIDVPRNRSIKKEQRETLKERSHNPNVEIPFELDLAQHESLESHLPEGERIMSHKLRQTDIDAMWAKKGEETHYGYKDHVVVDSETKLIVAHEVTPANIADVTQLVDVVPEGTEAVYDDAGYVGEETDRKLKEKCPDVEHFTAKKGQKNKPLTQEQKDYNREIVSRVRARVEHVFGFMTYCMGGLTIRSIGLARAKCKQSLRNFAYNIMRYASLVKHGKASKMAI